VLVYQNLRCSSFWPNESERLPEPEPRRERDSARVQEPPLAMWAWRKVRWQHTIPSLPDARDRHPSSRKHLYRIHLCIDP
jgi:hypothetical protein